MTEHTSGPWFVHVINVTAHIGPGQECPRNLSGVVTNIDLESLTPKATGQALANARLIAAAPDLLEALEALEAQVDNTGRYFDPPDAYAEVPWEFIDQARAAIAKAKGETND